jgi:hypothetical protein
VKKIISISDIPLSLRPKSTPNDTYSFGQIEHEKYLSHDQKEYLESVISKTSGTINTDENKLSDIKKVLALVLYINHLHKNPLDNNPNNLNNKLLITETINSIVYCRKNTHCINTKSPDYEEKELFEFDYSRIESNPNRLGLTQKIMLSVKDGNLKLIEFFNLGDTKSYIDTLLIKSDYNIQMVEQLLTTM